MLSLPQQEVFKSLNRAFQLGTFSPLSLLQVKKNHFILFSSNRQSL